MYIAAKQRMYAESKKSIYITLEALLLFGTKISKILEEMGYQRNKYGFFLLKFKQNMEN